MTDIREKVARAIAAASIEACKMEANDETVKHYTESFLKEADAALLACGYQKMREALEWRPIETAPHETLVLLYSPGFGHVRYEVGYASSGSRRTLSNGDVVSNQSWHGYATHWMPLPSPPALRDDKS